MPGTRTAPDVSTAPPTKTNTSLHLVDASGDTITDNLVISGSATLANIEAWAASYQDASEASLWKVTQSIEWEGDIDPDNANAVFRASVKNGVNLLMKNLTTLSTQTPRLVAPIAGVMQGNQDIPLLTATEMVALITEIQVILAGYNLVSAQYTDRRERSNNPRIRA